MKVVFLCKREYMSKDVIDDHYARLFEIPFELAKRGHQLSCFCFSYRNKNQGKLYFQSFENQGSISFQSLNLGKMVLPGILLWLVKLKNHINKTTPDIIIGASDSMHCILAQLLSNNTGIPYALDLYDNFESFGLTKIPGVLPLYRKAISRALWVSCVSDSLKEWLIKEYQPKGDIFTLESTITAGMFAPLNQIECRQQLSLPESAQIIGIAGALTRSRGIDTLYRAFSLLQQKRADGTHNRKLYLALAGSTEKDFPPPQQEGVIYLGNLRHEQVNVFFNALNVAVIIVVDSAFGRFSFPQKAYEMISARVPIVATAIGAMENLFSHYPQSLYDSGDVDDLCQKLAMQLEHPIRVNIQVETWEQKAASLEATMYRCLNLKAQ